jgi:phosphate transport system protein
MLNTKINELKKMLMEQAALVQKMVIVSMNAIQNSYECNLDNVMRYESRVNNIELKIDNYCLSLIALHQPEAKDLRTILMCYRINNDLERLADQAVNITESANAICGFSVLKKMPGLAEMKQKAIAMLHKSVSAFLDEDIDLSRQVCADDNAVDQLNNDLRHQLVEEMKQNPESVESNLHIMRICSNLERIADLSTNIAENTVFLVQGKVIKHHLED